MLITRDLLNKALAENCALFKCEDIIDKDVFYDLFQAPNVRRKYANGNVYNTSYVTKEQRIILCENLKDIFNNKETCNNYLYYDAKCSLCGSIIRVRLTYSMIVNKNFNMKYLSDIPSCTVTKSGMYSVFISYKELFDFKYKDSYPEGSSNMCICKTCTSQFMQNAKLEAKEIINREDKFEWFFENENSKDWRVRLFYRFKTHIECVDESVWYSEAYKQEQSQRIEAERLKQEHAKQIEEAKRRRSIEEEKEKDRVRRSNELFLANHQIDSPTQRYINKFCSKESMVNIKDPQVQHDALYPDPELVEYEAIQKHNCTFYREYLQTPLWKIISSKVKWNSGYKCARCNSTENLQVHHKNYDFKGIEFLCMESLECLCEKCHAQSHKEGN